MKKKMIDNKDILLKSYDFHLPENQIAQEPAKTRDCSKLLVFNRKKNEIVHAHFHEIAKYLPTSPDDKKPLFIANNSKVVPARLFGLSPQQGKRELLLLTPPIFLQEEANKNNNSSAEAQVLLKPSKSAKIGSEWIMDGGLKVEVLEKFEFGKHRVRLTWEGDICELFEKNGHLPLPPYIKRVLNSEEDKKRYQTIYADKEKAGSVAAPTAGLHFTPELKQELLNQGCLWEEVTLHVGYGTFIPVRTDDIREHPMHSEYFELSTKTVQAVIEAKKENRPVIAVGTTSCRVLEGAAQLWNNAGGLPLPVEGMKASTNIFIHPQSSHKIQIVDSLITNFHLPESSLLMLVSALTGRETILDVYSNAVENNYRFFSYGDAMLVI